MKSSKFIKIGLGVIFAAMISLLSLKTFAHKSDTSSVAKNDASLSKPISINDNISITIDSNTSDSEFEDITALLKEQQITAAFTQIGRNDTGEITGIKIVLTDATGNQAVSQMSSNMPIPQLVFGKKDGSLYITQSDNEGGAMAFFNRPNMAPFGFSTDSLGMTGVPNFGNFNFDDFFNDEDKAFFLKGQTLNLDELRERMKKQMESNDVFSNHLSQFFDSHKNGSRFSFTEDNSNKLIIIDGKESDFKTLDQLVKSNSIKTLDHLQPDTAISIYGKKANNGAIIATTINIK